MTLDRTFYSLLAKQEIAAALSYRHVFFLIIFLEEAFIINITIIPYVNYNNAIINKLLWKVPRHYSALPNSQWHPKEFLRNLLTVGARGLIKVNQPCLG